MTALRIVNTALVIVLVLLVRRLIWCLRWLWCHYHGQEVPDPIGWLPQQSGRVFARHVQDALGEEDEHGVLEEE